METIKQQIPRILTDLQKKYPTKKSPVNIPKIQNSCRFPFGVTLKFRELFKRDMIKDTYPIEKLMDIGYTDDPIKRNDVIYLYGQRGNGKSIAIQYYMTKLLAIKEYSMLKMRYISMTNLIMELYSKSFEDKVKFLKEYIDRYDILAIDEIDKITLTDYKEEMIFYLLDERINKNKLTIMASNSKLSELKERLKENIISRMLSNSVIVENKGELLR